MVVVFAACFLRLFISPCRFFFCFLSRPPQAFDDALNTHTRKPVNGVEVRAVASFLALLLLLLCFVLTQYRLLLAEQLTTAKKEK